MDFFHNKLRKKFSWYSIWHNHPRHSHAHWLIFVFTLLFIGSLLSVQVIGLYPENINRASAQTGTIQVAPILSSWSPPQTANGWWAKLSPDGRYVTYGNWGENWVTDLQTGQSWDFSNPAQLVPGGRCIAGYWTLPDTLTFVCEAGQDAAGYMFQRYEVKVGTWVPVLTSDDLHLVAGGFFAKDGHWATYWPFRLVKDNKTLIGSVGGSANPNDTGGIGGLTGSLMATACDNTNTSFCIWDGDTLAYSYPTQFGFYDLRIGEGSYVAYGDRYNLQGVCLSDWQEINLKAGDPAAAEGIHAIFGVNGKPWLASATWNAGPMYLLLRPWGERKSIVVQVDSVHSSIVHNNGIFTIAYHDDVGRMKVITVADTAPRNDLTGGLKDETCGATATILPPEYYEPTSFNPSNQPFGATQTLPNPPAAMPLGDFIGYIFLYSLYMVGLTVFVMITWAGVLWLTSRGNPSQIALAKHKIYNAIIGAIILVSGFAILYSINPALVQGTIRFPGLVPSATTGGNLPNPQPSCLNELGLANQYNEPYPRRDDPELAQLMFCIQNHPSLVGLNLGSIYTYDETYDVCNYTRGNQVCGPCSHSVNSCHYGGSSGTRGSLAVDYGNEAIGNLIIQAAVFCGAKTTAPGDPRCENSQGQRVACNDPMATHVHINAATCDRN